jgi:hypothetical protein
MSSLGNGSSARRKNFKAKISRQNSHHFRSFAREEFA